jgi:superfamily II DNA or RNA helicase
MKVNIKTPTNAEVTFTDDSEKEVIRKALSFKNTSISFQIKKHKANIWWERRDPDGWDARMSELQRDLFTCLLEHTNGSYYIKSGSIPWLKQATSIYVESSIVYPALKSLPWKKRPDFEPYHYQSEAVKLLIDIKHGNVSLPTGCGKSYILLLLARTMGLDTVIVTPSKSIFNELLAEFQERLGKQYVGGYGDGKKDIKKKITIAIGKSLTMLKPGTDAYKFFKNKKALMVDESHTFAANQLKVVCHDLLEGIPYRMFVSATQTRGDGTEKMLQSIIGENVLDMDLKSAIDDGFLCPLKFNVMTTFSPSTKTKRDPIECKREHLLYNDEAAKLAAKIANLYAQKKNESTLILVEELRQIEMIINKLQVPYGYVHSGSKKDAAVWNLDKVKLQEQVDAFNRGDVKVLIGTRAIATGTNIYPTHNVINWVGGASEIITKQGTMGRATRKLEISKFKELHVPKPYSRIFDFRITGQPLLERQLQKRIQYYSESGGKITFV